MPSGLLEEYNTREHAHGLPPSALTLRSAFKGSIAKCSAVYMFIDGLDELAPTEAETLIDCLFDMRSWAQASLHLIVTSQFHALRIRPHMLALTSRETRLNLEDYNKSTIYRYVQWRLSKQPLRDRWREKKWVVDKIQATLYEHSEGSYVFANLEYLS